MKKILLIILLSLSFTSICYSAESKKLIVFLDWFANPNHAPLFVAKEQGFFKQEGLDVELIGPADPSDPPKLVAAGKGDIAITYQPQFMEQVSRGLPLIRIGTLIDTPLSSLVVLKESSIKSLHQLKNKRIGYSSGGMTNLGLKIMLESNKLNQHDVERINVHYDLTQALLTKKVDAVTGMMRNFELIQLEQAGHPGLAFYPEKNGVPTYSELIFVIHQNNSHDPRIRHFLIALQKGIAYLKKNPQRCWEQFSKENPALNDELNKRAWWVTLPLFPNSPTHFDKKNWLTFAKFLQKNGLIDKVEKIDRYAI